jgi:processive 1,2-diacylglycerol beta-glucosyltransferase
MKVLITSVPAGSGHVRAAEALLAAFRKVAPYAEAQHVQVTDLVTAPFRRFYVDGYRVAVNRAPSLWGHLYRYWDEPSRGLTPFLYKAQRFCSNGFYDYLDRFQPDIILTTHFLIPQLLSARPRALMPTVETVITDYDVHRFWVSERVSRYYVAHEDMRQALARYGVPGTSVSATGIPVHPQFVEPVSPSAIFRELGLDPTRRVVLVLTGGLGLNQLKNAVQTLFSLPAGTQIVTVAGKNELLRAQLDQLQVPAAIKLVNLGYVNNMHELLTISDLVITKPGGLTVTECLAKKKIMLLFSPIPGQEERNAQFLSTHKAAVWAKKMEDLPTLAQPLLTQSAVRNAILWHVERFARPHAAFAIAESITHAQRLAA